MARENQGLQIAMIVFVLLTIIFAVTTFIFYSQYSEANKKEMASAQQARDNEKAAREALQAMEEMKAMMGFRATDSLTDIQGQFASDMNRYAATLPKESQFYRPTLQHQAGVIRGQSEALVNEQATVAQLKADLAAQTELVKTEIAKHEKMLEELKQDKQGELEKFNAEREQHKADLAKIDENWKKSRTEGEAAHAELENKLAAVTSDLSKIGNRFEVAKGKLDAMRRETPDQFQGEIRWVSQRNGVVWIDLGHADALQPQTTFGVYAAGSSDMTELGKKASIEVTQLLGNHLAEARILADADANPIMPGDRIYTPVWSLGERRHFAVAGLIDLDGDGYADPAELQRFHALIAMNGGVVDAPMDAQGKRDGSMSMDTRYLVLGKEPDAASQPQLFQDFSDMRDAAAKLRVETLALEKFLDRMGWKRQSEVVSYDDGTGSGFSVQPDRAPRVSSGQMSDAFKRREPPRTSGGSAF